MPEPLLYTKAMAVAAIVSMVLVLAVAAWPRVLNATWINAACVVGISLGLAVGYTALSLQWLRLPTSGLDRLLTIVVPVTLGIESFAGIKRVPGIVAWAMRIGLSIAAPRILLHNSVYLSGAGDWTLWQTSAAIVTSGVLLLLVWSLLSCLLKRSGGISIPLATCLAIQSAGITVMLAGYIKGGAAAIPLVATLMGASAAVLALNKYASGIAGVRRSDRFIAPVIVSVGVVGLFGLLFIGRFFGEISTVSALAVLTAPLLCWASEIPQVRNRKPAFVAAFRLVLVAIPLAVVLVAAKREFDSSMLLLF
tara:strand:+ start:330830 stop:331753 length:924 start_codon:yes stop_codon:yes gene_type:complete